MKAVYFHGGPGFNSNPERHLLAAPFAERGWDVRFWNEPSAQRPDGPAFRAENAFDHWLASAEEFFLANAAEGPIVAIGHSFGAHAVRHLALRHPKRIAKAVFIAPDLVPAAADRGLYELVRRDFEAHGETELAHGLATVIANLSGTFDGNAERGFDLMVRNPRLFGHFWRNHARMGEFLPRFGDPGFGIDIEAFRAVRRSWHPLPATRSAVPALAVFGAWDVCVQEPVETENLREGFENLVIRRFSSSGHYPPVEEPERFLELIGTEVPRVGASSRHLEPAATPLF
jgi:pimeloyl-ACP methyl ester carboxylesterase